MNILSCILITLSAFVKTPQSTDIGRLAFFDETCGECWEEVTDLAGRVLLVKGEYEGNAEDGRYETAIYVTDAKGGEIWHKLDISEMPAHQHDLRVNDYSGNAGNVAFSFNRTVP